MATRTISNTGGNWSATAAWVEGAVPTAADDVVATGTSGNLTIDVAAVCRSINLTGYTGTLTHNAFTLSIGTTTAPPGGIALKFPTTGWTYTLANAATSAISFVTTHATLQTVDYGGKTHGNVTFNGGSTSNFAVVSALNSGLTASVTSTQGNLHLDGASDNAGLSHTFGVFVASGGAIRTINPGTATFNFSATGNFWTMGASTNITWVGGAETIIHAGSSVATSCIFNSGGLPAGRQYGTLDFRSASETSVSQGVGALTQCVNYYRTGTPTVTTGNTLSAGVSSTFKVTGTYRVHGASAALPAIVWALTTLDVTGATVDLQYVNFQDITAIGMPDLSGILGGSGDCGGNSGIIFTPAVPQAWQVNASGNFSDLTKWTSRIPLPQDPITIATAFTGGPTVTCDMAWTGPIDASGGSGNYTLLSSLPNGGNVIGTFKGRAGLTLNVGAGGTWYFNSRKLTDTFTFGGMTILCTCQFGSDNGGLINFQDSGQFTTFMPRAGAMVIQAGATVGVVTFTSNASTTRQVSISGAGTLALISTGNIFTVANGGLLTQITCTLAITNTSATSKTIAGNGSIFPLVVITGGGTGAVIFTGANTFTQVPHVIGGTKTITLPSSTTTTFGGGSHFRNGSNVVTLNSSTSGTPATIAKPNGKIRADFLSVKDITATGAGFSAGTNSTDVSGNTGVTFTAPAADDHLQFAAAA